jgi:hypothetical protein
MRKRLLGSASSSWLSPSLFLLWTCSTLWTGHRVCVPTVRAVAAEEASPPQRLLLSVTEQRKQEYISLVTANYPPITVRNFLRGYPLRLCSSCLRRCCSLSHSLLSIRDAHHQNDGDRDNSLPIWPFINRTLPPGSLDLTFDRIVDPTITVGDMDLTMLVRVLYLSDTSQQSVIQTRLQNLYDTGQLRFWLQEEEKYSTYWTEVL